MENPCQIEFHRSKSNKVKFIPWSLLVLKMKGMMFLHLNLTIKSFSLRNHTSNIIRVYEREIRWAIGGFVSSWVKKLRWREMMGEYIQWKFHLDLICYCISTFDDMTMFLRIERSKFHLHETFLAWLTYLYESSNKISIKL